jgi:hypothetical protein
MRGRGGGKGGDAAVDALEACSWKASIAVIMKNARMRMRATQAPWLISSLKSPYNLFKAIPLGRCPNFGVGMAKSADQGRHLARCLDVLGAEYIQIIARS